MARRAIRFVCLILFFQVPMAGPALAQSDGQGNDRHSGYYYPTPGDQEVYTARAQTMPEAVRALRLGFVTGLSRQMASRPYAPPYAVFAKGQEAQKLIIVALTDGPLDTLYRSRAVLADLTAMARISPIFRDFGVEEIFTFLDLAKMLGFEQVTVSDGRDFAHQIAIK